MIEQKTLGITAENSYMIDSFPEDLYYNGFLINQRNILLCTNMTFSEKNTKTFMKLTSDELKSLIALEISVKEFLSSFCPEKHNALM